MRTQDLFPGPENPMIRMFHVFAASALLLDRIETHTSEVGHDPHGSSGRGVVAAIQWEFDVAA